MEEHERALLYRLLSGPYERSLSESILVGTLPPHFPITLPEASQVLGSTERLVPTDPGSENHQQRVILDTPLLPAIFLGQLRAAIAGDWQDELLPGFRAGGFLPAHSPDSLRCTSTSQQLMLTVVATLSRDANITQVDLTLSRFTPEQRSRMGAHMRMRATEQTEVTLRVPEGVTLNPGGGGGGSGSWRYSALIGAQRSVEALMAHFSSQLVRQGWESLRQTTKQDKMLGTWQRIQEIEGILLLSIQPAGQHYRAQLNVIQS